MNQYDDRAIQERAQYITEQKAAEKRKNYEARFGVFGKHILDAGSGGGFYAVPEIMDTYEHALGLDIKQAWLLKRLLKYLPNVKPSMDRIAKEAGISRSKVSRIKTQIINERGFIRDAGGRGGDIRGANELDLSPFFAALFLCAICDPHSPIVKGQAMDKVRAEFARLWSDDEDTVKWYERKIDFAAIELPLNIELAKKFAQAKGITLNWTALQEMQSGAALEKLETMKADKMRMLEVKDAINAGKEGAFGIVYNFGKSFDWLKWLASLPLRDSEITSLTASYVQQAENPSAKEYMEWMREYLTRPQLQSAIADREVYLAIAD